MIEQQKQSENKFLEELVEQFHRSRNELIIIQLVAVADSYRNELTELLLRKKTDSLRKQKKEILSLLIENPTIEDWEVIYDDIIRIGVDSFTRNKKFIGWVEKVKTEFSLPINHPNWHKEINHLEEVIATRNLLAHNGTSINHDYLNRSSEYYRCVGQDQPNLGDERIIEHSYCVEAIKCFDTVIDAIEVAAMTVL